MYGAYTVKCRVTSNYNKGTEIKGRKLFLATLRQKDTLYLHKNECRMKDNLTFYKIYL